MSAGVLLWLIVACLMLQPLSTDLNLASLPHLPAAFGAEPAATQLTLTLFVLSFGLAQPFAGPLSDRYGRRPVLLAALVLYLLASLACALSFNLTMLIAARCIQAIGCCAAIVTARALVRDVHEPAQGAQLLAKAGALLSLAPLLGPVLGGYLEVWFGWRAAFFFHVGFAAIVAFAALRCFRETNQHCDPTAMRPRRLIATWRSVAGSDDFLAWALPGAFSYAAIFSYISGSSPLLIRTLGVPTHLYGYCFAFGVCGYLLGALACRRLIGRLGLDRTLISGVTLTFTAGALFTILDLIGAKHPATVLACMFLTMAAHGLVFPCALSGAIAPFPAAAGAAAGLLGALTMLAAFVAGLAVASSDGAMAPLAHITAVIGALALFSAMTLRRRRLT